MANSVIEFLNALKGGLTGNTKAPPLTPMSEAETAKQLNAALERGRNRPKMVVETPTTTPTAPRQSINTPAKVAGGLGKLFGKAGAAGTIYQAADSLTNAFGIPLIDLANPTTLGSNLVMREATRGNSPSSPAAHAFGIAGFMDQNGQQPAPQVQNQTQGFPDSTPLNSDFKSEASIANLPRANNVQSPQTGQSANPGLNYDIDGLEAIIDLLNRKSPENPARMSAEKIAEEAYTPPQTVEYKPYQPSQNKNPFVRFLSRAGDTLSNGRRRNQEAQIRDMEATGMANTINQQGNFQDADRMRMQAYLQQATGTDLGNASMAQAVPGQQAASEQNQRAVAGQLANQGMQQPIGPELLQQLMQASGVETTKMDPQTFAQLLEYFMSKANPLGAMYGNMPMPANPLDQIPINR